MTAYETPLRTRRKGDKTSDVTTITPRLATSNMSLSVKHLLSMAQAISQHSDSIAFLSPEGKLIFHNKARKREGRYVAFKGNLIALQSALSIKELKR